MEHTFDINTIDLSYLRPLSELDQMPAFLSEYVADDGNNAPFVFGEPQGPRNPTGIAVQAWLVEGWVYHALVRSGTWRDARQALSDDPADEELQARYATALDGMFRTRPLDPGHADVMTAERFAEQLPAITDEIVRGDLKVLGIGLTDSTPEAYLMLTQEYVPLVEADMEWMNSRPRWEAAVEARHRHVEQMRQQQHQWKTLEEILGRRWATAPEGDDHLGGDGDR